MGKFIILNTIIIYDVRCKHFYVIIIEFPRTAFYDCFYKKVFFFPNTPLRQISNRHDFYNLVTTLFGFCKPVFYRQPINLTDKFSIAAKNSYSITVSTIK